MYDSVTAIWSADQPLLMDLDRGLLWIDGAHILRIRQDVGRGNERRERSILPHRRLTLKVVKPIGDAIETHSVIKSMWETLAMPNFVLALVNLSHSSLGFKRW